jgi:branched-chain amino acid transport system substrate-binding protein
MNAGSSSIKITEEGNPYTFRIMPNEVMQNSFLAEKAVTDLKLKKFVTAHETTDSGIGNNKAFVDRVTQLGGTVLDQIPVDRELADFNPLAARVKQNSPDGVANWMLEGPMVKLVKALKEAGVKTQLLSTIWSPASFDAKAGDAAEGMIRALQFWVGDPNPLGQQFTAAYRAKYGEDPDHLNAQGYDQMMLVADVAKRGGTDREGIRQKLAETKGWKGVMGTVTLDEKGQNIEMDAMRWVKTLPGGQLEQVKW